MKKPDKNWALPWNPSRGHKYIIIDDWFQNLRMVTFFRPFLVDDHTTTYLGSWLKEGQTHWWRNLELEACTCSRTFQRIHCSPSTWFCHKKIIWFFPRYIYRKDRKLLTCTSLCVHHFFVSPHLSPLPQPKTSRIAWYVIKILNVKSSESCT